MGRPLFVAPVETDLPSKDAPKRNVLSPSRSAIRRSTQAETRDRQNPSRRAAVRILALQSHSTGLGWPRDDFDERNEELNRLRQLPPTQEPSSGSAREALRDVTTRPTRSGRPLEDRMSSLFGGTWQNLGPPSSGTNDEGRQADRDFWGAIRPRRRRARIVAPEHPRRDRSPHGRRVYHTGTPPHQPRLSGLERDRAEEERVRAEEERRRSLPPSRAYTRDQARAWRILTEASEGRAHPDGLGDRDRSLSPEVWDTFISTLTPDPQPPSASSSFAFAAVTQGAGPSNAPPSAPGPPAEGVDGACESGHEMSDEDEDAHSRLPFGFHRQLGRHFRHFITIPDYNLDGPADRPADRPADGPADRPADRPADGPADRPVDESQSHRSEASRPGQSPGESRTNGYALLLTNNWLTQAGSEDERGGDRRPNREGSAGSGSGAAAADEEWLGMRRIVQSLAAREDIPDEWWAEAGLSRTFPHDELN